MELKKGQKIDESNELVEGVDGETYEVSTETKITNIKKVTSIKPKVVSFLAQANNETVKETEKEMENSNKSSEEIHKIMINKTADKLINKLSKEGLLSTEEKTEIKEIEVKEK